MRSGGPVAGMARGSGPSFVLAMLGAAAVAYGVLLAGGCKQPSAEGPAPRLVAEVACHDFGRRCQGEELTYTFVVTTPWVGPIRPEQPGGAAPGDFGPWQLAAMYVQAEP